MVARWDFSEGQGTLVDDLTGNGNAGTIHGAKWVKLTSGRNALELDGVRAFVDCGAGKSLDLTGALSLEAWVKPTCTPGSDVGILGKYYESYLLTFYGDGNCWWYINDGTNHTKAALEPGAWHHVAATFDGATMCLYVNGRPLGRAASKFRTVNRGRHFLMGTCVPARNPSDPAYANIRAYKGQLADVRVYNRALAPEEALQHYKQEAACYGIDINGVVNEVTASVRRLLAPLTIAGPMAVSVTAAR